jgi:hypothetical protein
MRTRERRHLDVIDDALTTASATRFDDVITFAILRTGV